MDQAHLGNHGAGQTEFTVGYARLRSNLNKILKWHCQVVDL
jgi:hypothetical protein